MVLALSDDFRTGHGRFRSIKWEQIQFNELVILLTMNGLCFYQQPLEIVQENLPLI